MVKTSENLVEKENNFKKVLKGSLISIIITIILLLVFSVFLTYTNISEKTIPTVTILITGISILIGSQISVSHIKKKGIINGGAIGLVYIFLIYIISSIVGGNFTLNLNSIIMMATGIIAGCFGGIIGVNMK